MYSVSILRCILDRSSCVVMIRKSIGQETKGCNRPWKIPLPKAILCSQWTMLLLPPSCHCCKYIGHHAILLTQSLAKSCFVGRSWNTSFLYPHYKRCKSNFVVLYFYASSSASSTFLQRLLVKILSFVFVNEWRKRRDRKTLLAYYWSSKSCGLRSVLSVSEYLPSNIQSLNSLMS